MTRADTDTRRRPPIRRATTTRTSPATWKQYSTRSAWSARSSRVPRWARTPRCALPCATRRGSLALGLITPSFDPERPPDAQTLANWDALAEGLRERGVEGFVDAYDFSALPGEWRGTVEQVVRQRLAAHEHPEAVADALEVVPRSRPFERIADLAGIEVPTVVVASRDEADPGHPLAIGERYARTIPAARLVVEDPSSPTPPLRSPIAWQGGQLSKVLAELATNIL